MKLLYRCINYFGFGAGLVLFIKLATNNIAKLKLPGYSNSFALRKNTTDIHMFRQVFFNQCYEYQINFNPKIIIDAGANIGLASIFYAEKYPKATIFSIEPQKDNFAQLLTNTKKYSNVQQIQAALFNSSLDSGNIQDIGLGESGFVVSADDTDGEAVDIVTIDGLMDKYSFKSIDILKIDIEGSEYELFSDNHYESWLPNVRCLIIELHDDIKQGTSKMFMKAISKYNFHFDMRGENLIFLNLDQNSPVTV